MLATGHDLRCLAGLRIAAVGKATAAALRDYHLVADVIPHRFDATGLTEELGESVRGEHVLIVRASRGSRDLPDGLHAAGAEVEEIVAYQNTDVPVANPDIVAMLRQGEIDWVTVTSSATAENLQRLYGDSLANCRFAAISPITADVLRGYGHRVDAVAKTASMQGLVDAIRAALLQ